MDKCTPKCTQIHHLSKQNSSGMLSQRIVADESIIDYILDELYFIPAPLLYTICIKLRQSLLALIIMETDKPKIYIDQLLKIQEDAVSVTLLISLYKYHHHPPHTQSKKKKKEE